MSNHNASCKRRGSLVDRGANGGILGNDAIVIREHRRSVDVTGIDNHEMTGLKIVDGAAKVTTQRGPAILILNQYAHHGLGRTIHSSGQIESYKNKVDDKSIKVGGRQVIQTLEGYILPLDIINGLPHLAMDPPTSNEMDELPHIILTPASVWNPKTLDNNLSHQDDWINIIADLDNGITETPFDMFGNYKKREVLQDFTQINPVPNDLGLTATFHQACNLNERRIPGGETKPKKIDYESLRRYLLYVPVEKVRRTIQNTTQWATNITTDGYHLQKTIKSPYPAHNVYRRNEPVATDTMYAAVAAVTTNGHTYCQVFVGRKSLVIDVYSMGTSKEFVNTLEDVIRKRGAMDTLIADSASDESSARVKDVLRALQIKQ